MKNKKTVFITGGTSGIGLQLAEMLIAQGHDIALFHVTQKPEVIRRLQSLCISTEQKVKSYLADISNSNACNSAIEKAIAEFGAPSLAINSAGVLKGAEFENLSVDDFEYVVKINLFGSRNFASAIIPHLSSGARLVFVSSLAGITSCYGYSAYSASKHAVLGMAGALRIELKPKGISISLVCPPEINTPMVEEELKSIHPATRALKDFAGTLELEPACEKILKGIEKRQYMIIPGFKAKMTYFAEKCLPNFLVHKIADGITARVI